MGLINKLFFKGFIVVMPITLTFYLLFVISVKAESLFGGIFKKIVGESLYIPGFGIALTIIFILTIGVLVNNYLTGKVIKFLVAQIEKMPLIKAIYGPLRDLMSLFGNSSNTKMQKVVLVNFEKMGFKTLGLVTREEFSDFGDTSLNNADIAVYIPMGYMIGGFTVVVKRSELESIDMPVERALKLAVTGWIKAEKSDL